MELIEGKIEKLVVTANIGYQAGAMVGAQSAVFEISGTKLLHTSAQPFQCQEGDLVVCAGTKKMGSFRVYAYKDRRTKAIGFEPSALHWVVGTVFLLVGLGFLVGRLLWPYLRPSFVPEGMPNLEVPPIAEVMSWGIPCILGAAATTVGVLSLRTGWNHYVAAQMVEEA